MSLVESLLGAIVRLEGDALVLHTGEKPYVVTSSSAMNAFRGPLVWGQVELSTRDLSSDAILGMLDHLLTAEQRRVLDELGAVENELPATEERPTFTVIAARGGDDIWVEIKPVKIKVPELPELPELPQLPEVLPVRPGHATDVLLNDAQPLAGGSIEIVPDVEQEHLDEEDVARLIASAGLLHAETPLQEEPHEEVSVDTIPLDEVPLDEIPLDEMAVDEPPLEQRPLDETPLEFEPAEHAPDGPAEHASAVVLPLARTPHQPEPAPATAPPTSPDIERLLRVGVARGASGLYLISQSRPTLRVDGEMHPLEGEEPLSVAAVEALTLALAPETTHEAAMSGEGAEWFRDVPELGRVRCLSFRDHRGPGVIVRMLPPRAISVEQLGLSKEIQALCAQPDGLVLVCGPRASGKSTLLAAFVDLVNRTRADHVITIERQITFAHEARRSLVSQREVRGEARDVLAAVRAALREDPDVLVIEELRSPEIVAAMLEAVESGRLVFAGLRAPSASQGLERLVTQIPAERRSDALGVLSLGLRGVVSQVLLRKRGGGRIAARELLLNTAAAASVIAEGKLFQLSAALESGRKLGSVALNDALAALVRDGVVDAAAAWRRTYDRDGLIALFKHDGADTAFLERLA